jgi:glycosyltransferase 2 family protein
MTDRRRIARAVGGASFLVLAFALACVAIWRDRHRIGDGLHRLPIASLLLSLVLAAGAVLATLPMWRSVLRGLDVRLPLRPAARVFFLGQLGKYLPGSIWPVVAQMELARRHHVPRARMLAASVLTVVINVAVGGVLAMVLLPFVNREALHRFWWLLVCLPVIITLLHPRIVMWAANQMLVLLRRPRLDVQLGLGAELRAAAWGVVSWLLLGGHIYVLVAALGATGVHAAAASVAAGCLAISAGTLFLPAPAGAGVREIAFTVSLSTVLPTATALLVALLSRVMLIVVDFGFAALAGARPTQFAPVPDEVTGPVSGMVNGTAPT